VKCLFTLLKGEEVVIVSPVKALMQKVIPPTDLKQSTVSLVAGEELDREPLVNFLKNGGYTSVRIVEERGDFSIRGAIIDIYSPLYEEPLRLEFGRIGGNRSVDSRQKHNGLSRRVRRTPPSFCPLGTLRRRARVRRWAPCSTICKGTG
jgi:excinuclease UvrABC helicase subunit UvrB